MLPSTIDKLDDGAALRRDELRSWIVTAVLVVIGFLIRLVNLSRPNRLEFDETYYAKDAWSILHFGYERNWPSNADPQIAAGTTDIWEKSAEFIVHPQVGKWLIAVGEHLFGMNSFGWRFASLVIGSLFIGAVVRMARRLSRSTLIGGLAGLFIVVDGLSFVMSRIALLDIFQAFFTVAAVAAWLADRDWFRHRLADHLRQHGALNLAGSYGPLLLWRPWRLLSGVLFGLACGSKWNAVYVLACFAVLSLVFDYRARLTAGARRSAFHSLWREGVPHAATMVVLAMVVYLLTWSSWLFTQGGYDRQWGAQHPDDPLVKIIGAPLASLWQYHKEIFAFHTGTWIAHQTHTYQAHPFGWPVIGRVIGIDAVNDIQPGVDGCKAVNDTCLRVISGVGTPFLWWFAALAVIAGLFFWVGGRDWRFGVPIIAGAATWIGWFPNADRPTFYFYAIMIIPFTATVLAMILGKILGPTDAPPQRRRTGTIIVTAVTVLVIANFMFIYPILTDQLMTRKAWLLRMWFRSWI
ncbi:dolichyl-phosphate-mannose--protein mannosyltransferase [Propionibacterium cyclohexanicum]|uniref:dolichyl-phosphate-mannose--protein mannosyltransferase n=1 Tax=Propionibacterium cyclohexanicum TaxID=64702 RepID=UPI001FE00B97|nr:phospholipid carrier-dependent glycosyltransferase [Propionibacterium cyclohexanicum]